MSASSLVDHKTTYSRYRAHGVELNCDFPISVEARKLDPAGANFAIKATARPLGVVEGLWSGQLEGPVHQTVLSDGQALVVEEGRDGDHLIRYGENLFHLSSDLAVLSCTPPQDANAGWQRALLDWVTYTASVLAGMDALHASAVRMDAGVLAFAADSGTGKTTLATEFIAGGAEFFSDDVLTLSESGGRVVAYPGAPFLNLDAGRRELAEQLGVPLASFGDEIWVSPKRRASEPAPVFAVIILDRRQDGPEPVEFRSETFMTLRNLAIGLPHLNGTEQHRFEILAALSEQAPVLRLEANSAVPADALMRSIESQLGCRGAD